MFGLVLILVDVGPTVVRLVYLLVRRHSFGWTFQLAIGLLSAEVAGSLLTDQPIFLLVHLGFGAALFIGRLAAARVVPTKNGPAENRPDHVDDDRAVRGVSRRVAPVQGSASRGAW